MAVTPALVRKLEGAIDQHGILAGAANLGDTVYVDSSGTIQAADANVSAVLATTRGILTGVQQPGATAGASGEACTYVVFGPVSGFSSLTPGVRQFQSSTVGAITETAPTGAGTWTQPIGYAQSATVLFVNPGLQAPASNS
jgi:hypothetical protein